MNQELITDFINYLFYKRKGTAAPEELLSNWRALSPTEIDHHLSKLFAQWGLSDWHKVQEIELFLESRRPKQIPTPAVQKSISGTTPQLEKTPPPPQPTKTPPKYVPPTIYPAPKRKNFPWRWLLIPLLLALAFVGYSYVRFLNMEYIYAITDNIIVRNTDMEVVARMDLHPNTQSNIPVYQKLKAIDNKVHYRPIDSTDNTYPSRKVLLNDSDFWSYLFRSSKQIGYVNTNYVVDNIAQFRMYTSVFSDVVKNTAINNQLTALYRKIIIGSLNERDDLHNKYIVLHDYALPSSVLKGTTPIIRETLEKNVSYSIYAGLNNNRYYHFEGDIKNDYYKTPQELQWYEEGMSVKPLEGNFRFYRKDGEFYLYDVEQKEYTPHYAERDGSGRITGFRYVPPPPVEEPGFFDRLDSAFQTVIDTLF